MHNAPKAPDGSEYLWRLFVDLKNAGSVSYSEIRAYVEMTGEQLTPVEVDCLRRLDEAHMRSQQQ